MVSKCKSKKKIYEYFVSFIFFLIVGVLTFLVEFLCERFPYICNIFSKIVSNKTLTYINFFFLILELVVWVSAYITFMRLLCYCLFYKLKFKKFKKFIIYKIYDKNSFSFDTIMYTFIWIIYCFELHYALNLVTNINTFSTTLANFIEIYTGAAVLWFFYIKTCVIALKENASFDYNSNFLFVFAKIVRPILVATVAWIAIVINFILNYDPCDKFEGIRIISYFLNNLVTLYYPIIDIFTYVYSELYKN